jgi:hypothetical protein
MADPIAGYPVFPKRLVDLFYSAEASLLFRYLDPDRRLLRITGQRLRRPTLAAIEEFHSGNNTRALTLAALGNFDESF